MYSILNLDEVKSAQLFSQTEGAKCFHEDEEFRALRLPRIQVCAIGSCEGDADQDVEMILTFCIRTKRVWRLSATRFVKTFSIGEKGQDKAWHSIPQISNEQFESILVAKEEAAEAVPA